MTPQTAATITALCDNTNPMHADGWCWPEKAFAMAALVESERPALTVDLGIFGGRSMFPQALQARDNGVGVVLGLDPWTRAAALEGDHDPADSDWWGNKVDLEAVMRKFLGMVVRLGLTDVAIPVRASSQAFAPVLADASVGILHIDGNHSEFASMRDVRLYFPKVKPGGFIWLDDIHWPTNGKAVAWLDAHCEAVRTLVCAVGQTRLYRKA